jgi:predicted ester cyclase
MSWPSWASNQRQRGKAEMQRDEMLRAVEEHYRSFWQGDVDDFDRQMAPDFTDRDALADRVGPESAKEYARVFRTAFPDMVVTVDQSVVEGDWIAIRARWAGTNTGPALGQEPTGRKVSFGGMVFWRFDGQGRIAERWAQIDMASALAQLEAQEAKMPG